MIAARRAILLGGQWWKQKLPTGAKVLAIGDSIIQNNTFADLGATVLYSLDKGEVVVAQAINPFFHFENYNNPSDTRGSSKRYFSGANLGISSESTPSLVTRIVTNGEVNTYNPDVVIITEGTNDINGNQTVASVIANLQACIDYLTARRKRVIIGGIRPRATAGVPTTTGANPNAWPVGDPRWARVDQVNAWAQTYANPNIRPVWWWDNVTGMKDPAPPSGQAGDALPNVTLDGLHPSPLGAYANGVTLSALLATLINSSVVWFNNDPTVGNLLTNPSLTGTTGTAAGVGISGSVATSWTVQKNSGTGIAAVCSKGTDGAFASQILSFSVADNLQTQDIIYLAPTSSLISRASIPDNTYIQLGYQVKVSQWTGAWRGFLAQLQTNPATVSTYGLQLGTASQEAVFPQGGTFWIWGNPMKVLSTTTSVGMHMYMYVNAAGQAGTGTAEISRPIIRAVQDPTVQWPNS